MNTNMTPIQVGTQVVVKDQGMGTVVTVGCPVFEQEFHIPAFHVLIEGDPTGSDICFPADHVVAYIDVYEGRHPGFDPVDDGTAEDRAWQQRTDRDEGEWDADQAYESFLETRFEEDPQDLFEEAMDEGLQEMREARESALPMGPEYHVTEVHSDTVPVFKGNAFNVVDSADASELAFPVLIGQWPDVIVVDDTVYGIHQAIQGLQEIMGFTYKGLNGRVLTVWND